MKKDDFLHNLEKRLSGLSATEIDEHISFYREMIDDRMEEGLSEEDAVSAVGSVDDIIARILEETPLMQIAKQKLTPKRKIRAWEIILLILGSPIWLSLLVSLLAVLLSLYVSLWAVIISLWAVFVSLAASSVGCIAAAIVVIATGSATQGIALISVGILCAGLAIFMYYGCFWASRGIILLTRQCIRWLKRWMLKKEAV